MFATFMSSDNWQKHSSSGVRMANPTWEQVRQAILALDGKRRTLVSISDKEGGDRYMLIAGQRDGRFVVNATHDNVDFFSLVDPSRSADKVTLYVGGQDGDYEQNKCVPLSWTLEAAQDFFETGQLKSTLNWQSDY